MDQVLHSSSCLRLAFPLTAWALGLGIALSGCAGRFDLAQPGAAGRPSLEIAKVEVSKLEMDEVPHALSTSFGLKENSKSTEKNAEKGSPTARWFKKNWPYVVAAGLLAGVVTYVVIDRTQRDDSGPQLRIAPGPSE